MPYFFYYDIIVFMTYNNVDWLNSLQKIRYGI